MDKEKAVDKLNELLAGEISAAETYHQALAKAEQEDAREINRIRGEHLQAAETLESHIKQLGSRPIKSSGLWVTWSSAVSGSAKLFGKSAAIAALKQGEEHGKELYEDALSESKLPPGSEILVRERLLPQQREHIMTLERLMKQA